jgi:hypothetical protein
LPLPEPPVVRSIPHTGLDRTTVAPDGARAPADDQCRRLGAREAAAGDGRDGLVDRRGDRLGGVGLLARLLGLQGGEALGRHRRLVLLAGQPLGRLGRRLTVDDDAQRAEAQAWLAANADDTAMTPERLAALEREQADREAASPVAGRRFTRA